MHVYFLPTQELQLGLLAHWQYVFAVGEKMFDNAQHAILLELSPFAAELRCPQEEAAEYPGQTGPFLAALPSFRKEPCLQSNYFYSS
jgi:hypothetical protein